MNNSLDLLGLEERVQFLEQAVKELNPGLLFPDKAIPRLEPNRKIKYLVFCSKLSQAYDWAMKNPEISSLDWIRVQGDEWPFLTHLFVLKTHRLSAVLIGDPKTWGEKLEQFYLHLKQDGMIAETLGFS